MTIQIPFIGRENELAQLNSLIKEHGTQRVFCINGSGGVGKTRLVQEARQRFVNNQESIQGHIIDFDNHTFHIAHTLGLEIAKLLGEKTFTPYLEGLLDLRKMEIADISPKRIAQEGLAVNRAFANCFNKISAQKKIVLFLDTTDALEEKMDIWHYISDIFPNTKNCLLVIAGRDARPVGKFLQNKFGNNIQIIDLAPLGIEASELYLQQKQKQLHVTLEPELAQKLLLLAQGRPILIDLAVEWQSRNIPLDWLVETNLEELKSLSDKEKRKRLEEFEYNLVRHIANVRQPIDRLTLLMSRIYPLDEELLSKLFKKWSPELVRQRFKEAKTYTFVKTLLDGSITLHDEMRRMINEYILDKVDPDGDRQVRNSQIAVTHLQIKIKELEIQLKNKPQDQTDLESAGLEARRDLLTKQWVTHALISNVDKGFSAYCNAIGKVQRMKRYRFAEQLEEIVLPYVAVLDEEQLFKYRTLHGKQLNNLGQADEAITLFKKLLKENKGNLGREAEIHNVLAVSEVQRGELGAALAHQMNCLRILKQLGMTKHIPTVSNYVGYIHRLSGRWQKAIEFYTQAFEVALEIKARPGTIASIMNNIGYLYGMDGRYIEAIGYCEKAIVLWLKQNNEVLIGQGEATLGAIYGNKGDYDKAQQYLNRAISRFKRSEAIDRLASAYTELGSVYLIKGTDTNDLEQLKIACDYLDQSYGLATKHQFLKQIPKILLQSGYAYWELEKKSRARRNNDNAYEMGKEFYDLHTVVNSLVAKAEYDYDEEKYEQIPYYAELLTEILDEEDENTGHKLPLLTGRMKRILADIAFQKQEYDIAFDNYKQGLALIAQHGGYGKYAIQREVEYLAQKISTFSDDIANQWLSGFKDYWGQQEPSEKYSYLINWCRQVSLAIKLRSHSLSDSGTW
ncbi:tetratricopeptide repeat protein [Anaerolineales bacterium HSG25]|nr:tetratricopeptide repeat protein [Anaerolineales bacterium HSG25]